MTSKSDIPILLKTDPQKAFGLIYDHYYDDLCRVSYKILLDKDGAEDVVQEVLMEFWNKREQIDINSTLFGYLRRSVYNRSLNHIKNRSKFSDDETALSNHESNHHSIEEEIIRDEVHDKLVKVIESLPEKCRYAFSLSRFEEKTYAEIAEVMEISVKTVENQISKALKILRHSMVAQ